jgi:hypothetical protein
MNEENLREFTETRAAAPRVSHALILPLPRIQYGRTKDEKTNWGRKFMPIARARVAQFTRAIPQSASPAPHN